MTYKIKGLTAADRQQLEKLGAVRKTKDGFLWHLCEECREETRKDIYQRIFSRIVMYN